MDIYNPYDPKHYVGDYGILQISKGEAGSYLEYRLKDSYRYESAILSKENIDKCNLSEEKCAMYQKSFADIRGRFRKEFQMMEYLNFRVYALVDYYLERYFYLKKYSKVSFALNGIFEGSHSVEESARVLLQFIEDPEVTKKLREFVDSKEKRCLM